MDLNEFPVTNQSPVQGEPRSLAGRVQHIQTHLGGSHLPSRRLSQHEGDGLQTGDRPHVPLQSDLSLRNLGQPVGLNFDATFASPEIFKIIFGSPLRYSLLKG